MTTSRNAFAPTYHRDGTITYWSVYQQQWVRRSAEDIYRDDATMASQDDRFRARVARAVDTSSSGRDGVLLS